MALLLRDREAAPEAATPPGGGPHPPVPDFACEACGAGMSRGQDWCLECGTAARGRLGQRAGWRAAFTVVGLTLLLVTGAVLASYAALTSDAERTASAPTAGNGNPITAQTPGIQGPAATTIQPGATGPGTTPPAVVPGVTPATGQQPVIPTTRPVQPPTSVRTPSPTATPSSGSAAPSTSNSPSSGSTSSKPAQQSSSASVAPQLITLKKDAAATYDPSKRPGAEFGPPENAIDGKDGTVWDVTTPADGKPLGVGVVLNLGSAYALQSLRIATPTPGFTVELYGAVDNEEVPVDLIDKRWQHLTSVKDVADGGVISLKGKGDAPKYKLFLAYVTTPGEPTDPRVAFGELKLRGTP